MILKDKKILFVHIPKTGGQSIIRYLLSNLTDNQSIDHNPDFGLLRNKKLSLPGPQVYHHLFLKEYFDLDFLKNTEILNYYKFSIVRNPYDRFISSFYYNQPRHKKTNFLDLISSIPTNTRKDLYRHFCPQYKYLENNFCELTKIYKFEEDFHIELSTELNLKYNFKGQIKHLNKTEYPERKKLDTATIDWINKYYERDFINYGYKFK